MFQLLDQSTRKFRHVLLALAVLLVAGCSGTPEERAQSYYERGAKFLSDKDYVKASIEFKNALQLKKELVPAWKGLAEIEEHNLNWQGLVPILRTLVDLDPKDIETKLRLARLLLLGNALDDALKLVDAAIELNDQNVGALALKAAILLRLKDNTGAVREATKALAIDPGSAEALIVLAAEKVARNDPEGALLILNRAPAAQAQQLGIQLFKIKLFEQLGDLKQVEALLQKLVELYPQEAVFRRQLAKLYVDQKRPDDAEKELRAVATSNPANVEAGLDVVRFLAALKGPNAARQELLARINAGGEVFRYQIALAEFDFAQGNVADSVKLLESLIGNAGTPENILTAQIKLAELNLATKKLDASEAVVSEILKKDSRNINGLKLRALIRMERGQLDPAISDLRQALNDQPRSVELTSLLATAYERAGSIDLAEKQFAEATRTSGNDANVGLNYVGFLQRRGSAARAEDVLIELASRWPNNVRILSALAQVKLARRDWAGAEEIANSLRRIGNSQGIADQIMGTALSGQNKLEESIGVLQNAYASAPTAVQPMFSLVRALISAKQTDRAIAVLNEALQKNPANAEALVMLGAVQLLNNVPEQASKSFKTAIEQQPKNIVGYRALSDFYVKQNNYDEALKVVRSGLQALPGNLDLRMTLAGTFELKGEYDAAITEYDSILSEQPGSLIVANNLASLMADYRTDKASLDRAYSVAAILRKSQVPQFKDTLGWVSYQHGDYKAAVSLLEEAAAALPSIPLVRYHLGMSYIATGQNAKAVEQLEKALTLSSDNASLQQKISIALKKAGA